MKRKIIEYNPKLKKRANYLRKNSTLSEVLLWLNLKNKQVKGYDFHRQKVIDKYIVDFYCPDLMLAIEIAGDSHSEKLDKDDERQKRLESLGVKFLRFSDRDIKKNIVGVIDSLIGWIEENPRPWGIPPRRALKPTPPFGHPSKEGTK